MSIGGIPEMLAQISALTTRVTALEKLTQAQGLMIAEQAKAVADHWVLREELRNRNTAYRLKELETYIAENTYHRQRNVRAIQAILTLIHPDPDHPPITDEVIPNGEWLHGLMMHWIEQYGRLFPGEGAE